MQVLRPYQKDAVSRAFAEWKEKISTLIVCPTGGGKTTIFCEIARRFLPGRTMVMAHREELIFQARDRMESFGIKTDVEMADLTAVTGLFGQAQCVVATVQTLCKRLSRFDPKDFNLLIIDEFHHATSASYRKVLDYFKQNTDLRVLGVTATPDRADEEALGQVVDSVAFDYEILDAINDGWLVPIEQQRVVVKELDFSAVRTTLGDLNGADLAAVMEQEKHVQGIVGSAIELIGERQAILFAASVLHASKACEVFNRHRAKMATFICGETDKQTRRDELQAFTKGATQVLCNCGVACLDQETQILTDRGWVGHEEITHQARIACWQNGFIHFAHPLAIEVRDRREDERMVTLETKNRSIRVTEDHRIIYRKRGTKQWQIALASNCVGEELCFPISGCAAPFTYSFQGDAIGASLGRRLASNSYSLRKQGLSREQARNEALRRLSLRTLMSHLSPDKLNLDHCRWIGFWCGDGGRSDLQSGGVEYVVCGSDQWLVIAQWFEDLSVRCGFTFRKKRVQPNRPGRKPLTKWSFCRGTGFGPQFRKGGLYPIEQYLDKNGSEYLWSFTEEQFDAFIHGLWCADGDHGKRPTPKQGRCLRIYSSNRLFLNHIQAIACCRGYRANVSWKNNHGHQLGTLSLSKKIEHQATKYTMEFESDDWKPEKVWCVKSETGLIVTRRRGTVTITGNTEGFDAPNVSVILVGRPTESRSLYAQMAGRGLRVLPGIVDLYESAEERRAAIAASAKPACLLVDFVGNSGRHKLMSSADILGGKVSDAIMARVDAIATKAKGAVRMVELIGQAAEQLRLEKEAREARRVADEARRVHLVAKVQYSQRKVNPFDAMDLNPVKERGWDKGKIPSEKQTSFLANNGVNTADMTAAQCSQLIGAILERRKKNLCTWKQAKTLKSYGLPGDLPFGVARNVLDALAANHWRKPDGFDVNSFCEHKEVVT